MTPTNRQNTDQQGRRAPRTEPMFNRALPAHPLAVRKTLADMRRRFAGELVDDELGRLELVLAEVLNNITEHGLGVRPEDEPEDAPSIHLSIVRHVSGFSCAVVDNGQPLPAECLTPRNLPVPAGTDLPEGGWGWYMIHDLTQALCYYREGQRNHLVFNLPFSQS